MISEHFLNLKNARGKTLRKALLSLSSFHSENITADKRFAFGSPKLARKLANFVYPQNVIRNRIRDADNL